MHNARQSHVGAIGILILILSIAPVFAQDAPLARITLPIRGQTVRGSISIQGTATGPQFTQFQVAYAPEPDTVNWIILNGASQPVANGTLAEWNTRALPDGKYALRLQVFSSDGSAVEAIVREINLSNVETTTTPSASAAGLVTSTNPIGSGSGSTSDAGTSDQTINLSDLPQVFLRGVRYTLYAMLALGAYLALKRFLGALLRRVLRKPIDYGR